VMTNTGEHQKSNDRHAGLVLQNVSP